MSFGKTMRNTPMHFRSSRQQTRSLLCASVFIIGLHTVWPTLVVAQERSVQQDVRRLQSVVDALKTRLAIPEPVTVAIVLSDPLMMSVKPIDQARAFELSIEAAFLNVLTELEIEAAIAHELGHVWVFTHHPFLQTEQLANEIAMRVVKREHLERVYEKVWMREGSKGDMARFLGPQPTAGLAPGNTD
jgi:hypothetical protein